MSSLSSSTLWLPLKYTVVPLHQRASEDYNCSCCYLFPELALHVSDLDRYSGLADDRSACVFASEVAVLLKKDRVDSGDPASFRFSFVLPAKLIPSFKVRDLSSSIPRGFVGNLYGSFKVLLHAVLVVACAGVGLAAPCRHVFFLVVLPLLASDLFQVAVIV